MTIKDELIKYCKDCLADRRESEYVDYISGQAHKWACQRFLNDIKNYDNNPDSPYFWDEKQANAIVVWFHNLRHSKGILAGKPIDLTLWEKFIVCQIYGWRRRDNGLRRFRRSFVEVARKNAKSQLEGGIALYECAVTSSKNQEVAECYTAGAKRDQSKIVFNECKLMLKGSPLAEFFKVTRDSIQYLPKGSFIRPLSRDDGKTGDGSNPALLILDEYHQHKDTSFYDLGLGSNTKEPLLMIITTAGIDLNVPCYTTEYSYCKKLLDPGCDVVNEEYLADICELDKEDYKKITDIANERLWRKANPVRCTYEEGVAKIRGEYEIAAVQPEHMTAFLTKCLDIWVQAKENSYMDMSKFKACECKSYPVDIHGLSVYAGFDLSKRNDLTSVSFILPYLTDQRDENGKQIPNYILHTHSFIPTREKLAEHIQMDHQPYDAWERMGLLTVTDTPIVDQAAVVKYAFDWIKEYNLHIECLAFDPAGASATMMELSNAGYDVEEVWQSHRSLNDATVGFRDAVYQGRVHYLPNPLLNFAIANAIIKSSDGYIKIDKDKNRERIDPADATICAWKLASFHQFTAKTIADGIDKWLDSF